MKTVDEIRVEFNAARAKLLERAPTEAEARKHMLEFLRERGDEVHFIEVNGKFEPVYTHEQVEAAKIYFYGKYRAEVMDTLSILFNAAFKDD